MWAKVQKERLNFIKNITKGPIFLEVVCLLWPIEGKVENHLAKTTENKEKKISNIA